VKQIRTDVEIGVFSNILVSVDKILADSRLFVSHYLVYDGLANTSITSGKLIHL